MEQSNLSSSAPTQKYKTRVWDLPTRLFHWTLVLSVIGLIVTSKIGGNAMNWHFRLGYLVLALLLFRICWGLIGGYWSRFISFIYKPSSMIHYLKGKSPESHLTGHNPLGSLSVFGLLSILIAQVSSGLLTDDEIAFAGPLTKLVSNEWVSIATTYHKTWGQWILIALIAAHILALLFYTFVKRETLIKAMFTGDKQSNSPQTQSKDGFLQRLIAFVIIAIAFAFAYWVSSL